MPSVAFRHRPPLNSAWFGFSPYTYSGLKTKVPDFVDQPRVRISASGIIKCTQPTTSLHGVAEPSVPLVFFELLGETETLGAARVFHV